tara:strand:+ start:284 stop:760 length:477 start_codon:yes stop_codon:yes gene_type:complete
MSVNKIISTVNSISSDSTVIPDIDKCVTIDTSNNRLGINTLNPNCAIDVSNSIDIFKNNPNNYDDISANTKISSLELKGYLLRLNHIPRNISINDISNHLVDCLFARKSSNENSDSDLYFMTRAINTGGTETITYIAKKLTNSGLGSPNIIDFISNPI